MDEMGVKELSEEKIKSVTVRMPESVHRELKIKVASEGMKLQDYLLNMIKADLAKGGK